MKKFLANILFGVIDSFHLKPEGFSSRKLTAFVTMLCVLYIHFKFVDTNNSVTVMVYDMLFILLLLGIVTLDQLYRFKNLVSNNNSTQTPPTAPIAPVTPTAPVAPIVEKAPESDIDGTVFEDYKEIKDK